MGKDNFVRVTQHDIDAVLHFQKAKANLNSSELKDKDMVALKDWLIGFVFYSQLLKILKITIELLIYSY